jgi:hypothetical protein
MIKIGELKQGDIIRVNDDGVAREGTVISISHEEHQALVDNGVQEFWYSQDQMDPIPVNDGQLVNLGFEKEQNGASAKYLKGPFRIVVENGDFSHVEMWYREDRRHFNTSLSVHHLQNLYHEMTKVHLEKA